MARTTGIAVRLSVALLVLCAIVQTLAADDDVDLVGTAFVGKGPTQAQLDYQRDQLATAKTYVDCLLTAKNVWFGEPDFSPCDAARSTYHQYLPAEIADLAIGCLESGALTSPRIAGNTCEALHRRFLLIFSSRDAGGATP